MKNTFNSHDKPRNDGIKGKKVQDCKEPKVEIYKSIWSLVFKCKSSEK
jgi:hypothetical protein